MTVNGWKAETPALTHALRARGTSICGGQGSSSRLATTQQHRAKGWAPETSSATCPPGPSPRGSWGPPSRPACPAGSLPKGNTLQLPPSSKPHWRPLSKQAQNRLLLAAPVATTPFHLSHQPAASPCYTILNRVAVRAPKKPKSDEVLLCLNPPMHFQDTQSRSLSQVPGSLASSHARALLLAPPAPGGDAQGHCTRPGLTAHGQGAPASSGLPSDGISGGPQHPPPEPCLKSHHCFRSLLATALSKHDHDVSYLTISSLFPQTGVRYFRLSSLTALSPVPTTAPGHTADTSGGGVRSVSESVG